MPLSLVGLDLASAFYVRQAGKLSAKVLVLGSADGRVAFALAGRGHPVVAVEPSERMHATAEEKRLAALAASVAAVDGASRALPASGALPPVIRSVQVAPRTTTHATSGGSAAP